MVGLDGIGVRDMADYEMPENMPKETEAHFLGHYLPWDSHRNLDVAMAAGMTSGKPTSANLWEGENLDNAQTGLHDYLMFRKFGYGRGCAQASVDVRSGRMGRLEAMHWVSRHDGRFPSSYAHISFEEVIRRIGVTKEQFWEVVHQFSVDYDDAGT